MFNTYSTRISKAQMYCFISQSVEKKAVCVIFELLFTVTNIMKFIWRIHLRYAFKFNYILTKYNAKYDVRIKSTGLHKITQKMDVFFFFEKFLDLPQIAWSLAQTLIF